MIIDMTMITAPHHGCMNKTSVSNGEVPESYCMLISIDIIAKKTTLLGQHRSHAPGRGRHFRVTVTLCFLRQGR